MIHSYPARVRTELDSSNFLLKVEVIQYHSSRQIDQKCTAICKRSCETSIVFYSQYNPRY